MRLFSKRRNASVTALKRAVGQKAEMLPPEHLRLVAAYALGLRDGLLLRPETATSQPQEPSPPGEPHSPAPTKFRKG